MSSTNNHISYMYIEYSTAFHMKFKHLFVESVYDSDNVDQLPLIITWAEADMYAEDSNKYLAVATKTLYYHESFKVSKEFFEDALQAFFLFPDTTNEDADEEASNLRLEFVKALLNK